MSDLHVAQGCSCSTLRRRWWQSHHWSTGSTYDVHLVDLPRRTYCNDTPTSTTNKTISKANKSRTLRRYSITYYFFPIHSWKVRSLAQQTISLPVLKYNNTDNIHIYRTRTHLRICISRYTNLLIIITWERVNHEQGNEHLTFRCRTYVLFEKSSSNFVIKLNVQNQEISSYYSVNQM